MVRLILRIPLFGSLWIKNKELTIVK